MDNFLNYSKDSVVLVLNQMNLFLDKFIKDVGKINKHLIPYAQLFKDRNFGGKMLRGALVKLGYELAGGRPSREIYRISSAIEIFQTAILAQDDIIDKSPTRRGKPTIYKELGGDHHAVSQTIVLADIGFFLGVKLINESKFDFVGRNKAVSIFSDMVINTGIGEMLDVELPRITKNRTEEAVLQIHKMKTSYYTIIYPLQIGAVLAGAGQNLLKQLENFGENLGLAFQIQDDILGVFGDEVKLGKSVKSDIEEGKNTLLFTYAQKHADKKQLKILKKHYGVGKIKMSEHKLLKDLFIKTGSLDYSQNKALEFIDKAKKYIPNIAKSKVHKLLLEGLADYLVAREK